MALKLYSEDGLFNLDMLDATAMKMAKSFIRPPRVKIGNHEIPDKRLTTVELREFFIEIKAVYDNFRANRNNADAFTNIKPQLLLLKARAMYSCPKTVKNRRIPGTFRDFIVELVDSIKDEDSLEKAMMVFQAVIGYCYGYGIRD